MDPISPRGNLIHSRRLTAGHPGTNHPAWSCRSEQKKCLPLKLTYWGWKYRVPACCGKRELKGKALGWGLYSFLGHQEQSPGCTYFYFLKIVA